MDDSEGVEARVIDCGGCEAGVSQTENTVSQVLASGSVDDHGSLGASTRACFNRHVHTYAGISSNVFHFMLVCKQYIYMIMHMS